MLLPDTWLTMNLIARRAIPGVAILALASSTKDADLISFVDEVAGLIRDRSEVDRVLVRFEGEPSDTLRYLMRLLDIRAREHGKTVDFAPPTT